MNVDKTINAKGKVVLPGLINAHAHTCMVLFRETVDGYALQDWLEKKMWPAEEKLVDEDVYYASLLSCVEMIKTGTTTVADHYFKSENTIKAAVEAGVRLEVTRVLMDIDNNMAQRKKELEELIKNYKDKYDTIGINVGLHGLYSCSKNAIEEGIRLAKKYDMHIHMHFCENFKEVEEIKQRYDVTYPGEVLQQYFSSTKNILAHGVKLTDKDMESIKNTNSSIIHCPVSNLKLGCGIAPINKMKDMGINIALGTDGQGSGSNMDMFESMKYACLLQKGILEDPKVMDSYEVLKMATINGAKALGISDKVGTIEEGKLADLIILNLETETTKPINNLIADIVYNAKGSNVETTIINGKVVMEKRKLKNINEKQIFRKCEKISKRILEN